MQHERGVIDTELGNDERHRLRHQVGYEGDVATSRDSPSSLATITGQRIGPVIMHGWGRRQWDKPVLPSTPPAPRGWTVRSLADIVEEEMVPLQRQVLDRRPMTLVSPRFAWNHTLQAAARNSPPLRRGSQSTAVRLFQQGLIDAGFPLPVSTRKHGSPDGIYGAETKGQCWAFQRREGLSHDGIAGKNTLHRLDQLLPGNAPPLPPLPAPARYVVPGDKVVLAQPTSSVCWATVYCMMISWKDQTSYGIEQSVDAVASKYGDLYRNNRVLPFGEFGPFMRAAGLKVEPMANPTLDSWVEMLRAYGLLWVGQLNAVTTTAGWHSRIVDGVIGADDKTAMMIIDPDGGRRYNEGWERFLFKYEEAFARLTGEYFQIRHF